MKKLTIIVSLISMVSMIGFTSCGEAESKDKVEDCDFFPKEWGKITSVTVSCNDSVLYVEANPE